MKPLAEKRLVDTVRQLFSSAGVRSRCRDEHGHESNSLALTEGGTDGTFRASGGNIQADEILGGGFPSNSINILMGPPGTGKTIFAERMLFHNVGGIGRSSISRHSRSRSARS